MKGSKGHKYICHTNPKNVRFCDTILWNTSKMTCGVNIFPELEYKWPHKNTGVAHGLEKQNNFLMDPMLGKGRCEIIHIAYVHLPCKNHLNKQWVPCTTEEDHHIYAFTYNWIYARIIGSFDDWKLLHLTIHPQMKIHLMTFKS